MALGETLGAYKQKVTLASRIATPHHRRAGKQILRGLHVTVLQSIVSVCVCM